jgi:hypothetical protein
MVAMTALQMIAQIGFQYAGVIVSSIVSGVEQCYRAAPQQAGKP